MNLSPSIGNPCSRLKPLKQQKLSQQSKIIQSSWILNLIFIFSCSGSSPQFICVEVPRLPRDALVEWQVLASPMQKDDNYKTGSGYLPLAQRGFIFFVFIRFFCTDTLGMKQINFFIYSILCFNKLQKRIQKCKAKKMFLQNGIWRLLHKI